MVALGIKHPKQPSNKPDSQSNQHKALKTPLL